jgi:hypothetical protein
LILYLDSTIASGSTYTYYVKAYDEDGNISEASNSYTITMPPDIPANLTVTVREDGILLRWTGVNDICEYELSINEEIIKVGKENLFLQKEFLPNFRYEYRVRAVIGDIYGQWSESKEILTAPGKVENLKSEIIDDSAIKLSWDPVEGALSYDVEIDGILYQDIKDCYYLLKSVQQILQMRILKIYTTLFPRR